MKRGAKKFMPDNSVHINLKVSQEVYDFLDTFKIATCRTLSGSIRFAIQTMREKYNENGAKHGM